MKSLEVYTNDSKQYVLEEMDVNGLKGSEGIIYPVIGEPNLVAKVYNEETLIYNNSNGELEDKLKQMQAMNIPETLQGFLIAWPRNLIYKHENNKKSFIGYIMQKVDFEYTIKTLCSHDPDRIDDDPPGGIKGYITWQQSILAARNLSYLIKYLHGKGIEIGDFNEKNFMFDEKTGVFGLVDCGAYGIFNPISKIAQYRCKMNMPGGYVAPEKLLDIEVSDPRYTDYFYLAIYIFRLLMKDSGPFDFKEERTEEEYDKQPAIIRQEHIINGECIYVKDLPGKKLGRNMLKPGILPDDILAAFNRTFNYTRDNLAQAIKNRTTADEWCSLLAPYIKENSPKIIRCSNKKEHTYSAHLSKCPWCYPDSVSALPYEKRIKERQVQTQEEIKAGKNAGNQESGRKKANPSSKSDSEFKSIEEIAAYVRAQAKAMEKELLKDNQSKVHIGEPEYFEYDDSKARSALDKLQIHDIVIHINLGEGEVYDNSEANRIKVKFSNGILPLDKDQLAHLRLLKVYSYTSQEYNFNHKQK